MASNENEYNSLVHVSRERSLVARSAALAKRGLESLQTLDRVVTFPSDRFQMVFLLDQDANISDWEDLNPFNLAHSRLGCELIRDVTGGVRVPYRKYLGLGLLGDLELPLLSLMAHNSLDFLAFGGAAFKEDCYVDHLSQLKYLSLGWQSAFDNSLKYLRNLKQLTHLFFHKGKIDNGLSYLDSPETLSHLGFDRMELTEMAVASLSNFTSLSFLDLTNSNFKDSGLSSLYNLPSLLRLDLRYSEVSESAIHRLKAFLPFCDILA